MYKNVLVVKKQQLDENGLLIEDYEDGSNATFNKLLSPSSNTLSNNNPS